MGGIKGDILELDRGADFIEEGELFDDDGNIDIRGEVWESDIKEFITDPDDKILASFVVTIFEDLDDIDPKTGNPKIKYTRTLARDKIEEIFEKGIVKAVADMFRVFPDTIRSRIFDTEEVEIDNRVTPETAP